MTISKETGILLLGTLFSRAAMFMSVPFLSIYLTNRLQMTTVQAGTIVGMNPLMVVCSSFFVGGLASIVSPKKLITVVPVVWGFSYLSFYFTSSYWILLLLNGLNGICYAIYEPNTKKLLVDYSQGSHSFIAFNLRYAAINLGALAGPILAMMFNVKETLFPYLILGSVYCIISLANYLVFKNSLSDKPVSRTDLPKAAFKGAAIDTSTMTTFLCLLTGVCFSYFGYAQFQSVTLSQYYAHVDTGIERYSYTLSMSQGIVLLAHFFVIRLTKHSSSYKLLLLSNLLLAASLLLVPFSLTTSWWLVMIMLYSFGELLMGTHFDYAVAGLANDKNQTLLFSLTELMKLGSALGPTVGSYLITYFGDNNGQAIFSSLAGITALGSICFLVAFRRVTSS